MFLQLALILSICNCAPKREIVTYNSSQEKQNVNVGLNVNDNANFSFTVSTSEPVILRTFIMQGFELAFSGEYEYVIRVPSAKDVENFVSRHPGEVRATIQDNQEKRPDIRPVITALNKTDVFIYHNGEKAGKVKNFTVSIDPQTGVLRYSIMLPNIYSMDLPISVDILSKRKISDDEFDSDQFNVENSSDRPQPFGVGQPSQPDDKQRELSINYYFGRLETP